MKTSHLNLQEIRDYTGADDEFIVKLFNKFLEHIDADIAKLEKASNEADWNAVKSSSHAMLSSARIFSLKEMITLHEQIEKDCINNTTARIPEMVEQISNLYREAISEIKEVKATL